MRRIARIGAAVGVAGLVLFNAVPAGAGAVAGKGSITGKVRAAGGGGTLAGKCVFAHDGIPGGQTIDAVRPTGANGAYRIKNVPAGQWLVAAWNCDGSQYQPQYYNLDNGVASDEEADPVTVNANQTTAGIAFKLRPAGSVHVTVTDPNGDPLANVLVVNTDNGEQSCFAGVTGDDGEVTNNGVPPGPTVEHVIDLDGDYDSVDVEINVPVGTTLELPVQMGVATTT